MSLFHDRFIKAEVGKSQTECDEAVRRQLVPCKLIIPKYLGPEIFHVPLHDDFERVGDHLFAHKIKGRPSGNDVGPYYLSIWHHSEDKKELEIHLSKPPVLVLGGVTVDELQMGDTEDEYLVSVKLAVPWKDKDQAGEVDSHAGRTVQIKLRSVQLGMDALVDEVGRQMAKKGDKVKRTKKGLEVEVVT